MKLKTMIIKDYRDNEMPLNNKKKEIRPLPCDHIYGYGQPGRIQFDFEYKLIDDSILKYYKENILGKDENLYIEVLFAYCPKCGVKLG
jgi:hypothetical protein